MEENNLIFLSDIDNCPNYRTYIDTSTDVVVVKKTLKPYDVALTEYSIDGLTSTLREHLGHQQVTLGRFSLNSDSRWVYIDNDGNLIQSTYGIDHPEGLLKFERVILEKYINKIFTRKQPKEGYLLDPKGYKFYAKIPKHKAIMRVHTTKYAAAFLVETKEGLEQVFHIKPCENNDNESLLINRYGEEIGRFYIGVEYTLDKDDLACRYIGNSCPSVYSTPNANKTLKEKFNGLALWVIKSYF